MLNSSRYLQNVSMVINQKWEINDKFNKQNTADKKNTAYMQRWL